MEINSPNTNKNKQNVAILAAVLLMTMDFFIDLSSPGYYPSGFVA